MESSQNQWILKRCHTFSFLLKFFFCLFAISFIDMVGLLCLQLPDYHEVIEHPMDFSTVRKKLSRGAYKNLEQFEVGHGQTCVLTIFLL